MLKHSNRIILGSELFNLCRPFVYAWCRKGEYLYIGATLSGLKRIVFHHVIGKVDKVLDDDAFELWYGDDANEVFTLERELIIMHQPKYNKVHTKRQRYVRRSTGKKSVIHCIKCFKPHKGDGDVCFTCRTSSLKVDMAVVRTKPIVQARIEKLPH
jgi:hypothetical protein